MNIYLAYSPEEFTQDRAGGYLAAITGCRLSGASPALLTPEAPEMSDSLLVLRDDAAPTYKAEPALARLIAGYAKSRYAGLVCDWAPEESPFYRTLAALLNEAAGLVSLPLWVPEACAEAAPDAMVLIGSDVVRGRFPRRMEEAARRYPGRCVLGLQPLHVTLAPPCSRGTRFAPDARESLQADAPSYRSEDLACMYFSLPEAAEPAFALYDSRETMAEKLRAAENAGFQAAIGLFQSLSALPEG